MDQDEFRKVVDDNLVPMLQATLEPAAVPSTNREGLASYPTHLRVKPTRDAGYGLVLTGVALNDLWDAPFGPVLTNGFDTLLVVGSDLEIADLTQRVTLRAGYRGS